MIIDLIDRNICFKLTMFRNNVVDAIKYFESRETIRNIQYLIYIDTNNAVHNEIAENHSF